MWKEVNFFFDVSQDDLFSFLPDEERKSDYEVELKNKALDEQIDSLRNELSRAKTVVNLLEEELKDKEKEILDRENTEAGFLAETYRLEKELESKPAAVPEQAAGSSVKSESIPQMFEEDVEYTEVEEKILQDDGKPGENYS